MRLCIFRIIEIYLLLVVTQGCQASKETLRSPISMPTLPDPHHHIVDIEGPGLVPELDEDLKIVQVLIKPSLSRENLIENPEGSLLAFTTYDQAFRIFVEDLEKNQVYEIQGITQSWRPITELVWATNDILVFDQWNQPHYGIHYAVNISERKLLLASPFIDKLPDASEGTTQTD